MGFWVGVAARLLGVAALVYVGFAVPHPGIPAPALALAFLLLPIAIVACVIAGHRWPGILVLTMLLIDAETLLVATYFVIGLAYSVLLPTVGLSFVLESLKGRALGLAFVATGATGVAGILLSLLVGPASADVPSGSLAFAVVAIVIFALYGLWRLRQIDAHRTKAVALARRELTARGVADQARSLLVAGLEQAADMVVVTDAEGIIEYVNPAFEHLTGYTASEVSGLAVGSLLRSDVHPREFYAELDAVFDRGDTWRGTITDRRKDGSLFEIELSVSPIRDATGKVSGCVHVGRDTTYERAAEADIAFEARVRTVLEAALRHVPTGASAGQAGQVLCDAVGGLEGIGFVAVFAFSDPDEIVAIAHHAPPGFLATPGRSATRAADIIAKARNGPWTEPWQPHPGDGPWAQALTAAGVRAVAFGPIVHGDHVDGVVSVATTDEVLAQILIGKGPQVLDLSTTPSALLAERLHELRQNAETRRALEGVIKDGAFHPVYQPIVNLLSHEVIGHEALTRFDSGQAPDRCFADAWSVHLGPELEFATLEAAITGALGLPAGLSLNLNLSPRLLAHADRLRATLHGADRSVVVEITEHDVIADYAALREAVRALGSDVRLAVDDAGAGIANFGHIVELRPDFVKLDISLVQGVDTHLGRQALVVAMRHFGRAAGCRLVAEGIETEEEARTLTELGVEFGQGFWLGGPLPAEPSVSPGA